MKRLLLLTWLAAALPALAGLKFEQASQDLDAKPEDTIVHGLYRFTNDGSAPVTVAKAEAGCSCVTAVFQDKKMTYAPGESGVVDVSFDVSNFSGTAEKRIGVWLKGDGEGNPTATLTLRVKIPVIVEADTMTLFWDLNGSLEAKTVNLTMHSDEPVHVTSVSSGNDNYVCELKTVEDGRRYQLVVTPKDVSHAGSIGVFRLETDCKVARQREKRLFASVRRPVPASPATAAPAPSPNPQ